MRDEDLYEAGEGTLDVGCILLLLLFGHNCGIFLHNKHINGIHEGVGYYGMIGRHQLSCHYYYHYIYDDLRKLLEWKPRMNFTC